MFLHDIVVGDEVRLEIIINDQPYLIPMRAVDVKPCKVWIEAFQFDGQIIDLSERKFSHLKYNLHGYDKAKMPYCWDNMDLSLDKSNNRSCYLISCSSFKSEGRPENKRMHDRVRVSTPAELQWRKENFNVPVMLYDLSDKGVAFLANEEVKIVDERIILEIRETIQDRSYWIKMECLCVRIMPKDGRFLYGCKFQILDQKLKDYIFAKQMQVRAEEMTEIRRKEEEERVRLEAEQAAKEESLRQAALAKRQEKEQKAE